MLIQIAADGILTGCVYSLIAAGLTVAWGAAGIINFSHGEFIMLSLYISFWMYTLFYAEPLISMPLVAIVMFAFGVIVYKIVIRHVSGSAAIAASIATFGLSLVLENGVRLMFSPDYRYLADTWLSGRTIAVGSMTLGVEQVVSAAGCMFAVILLMCFMNKTSYGKAITAVATDREAAVLVGIDDSRVYAVVFGLSGACVGIAGGLMSSFFPIHPESGAVYSVIAFIVAALGGIGSIPGAAVGGIAVGLLESVGGFYFGTQFKYAIVFIVYLIAIQIKPKGLFR